MINLAIRRALKGACIMGLAWSGSAWAGLTTFESESYFQATVEETYYSYYGGTYTIGVRIGDETEFSYTEGNASTSADGASVYEWEDGGKDDTYDGEAQLSAMVTASGSSSNGESNAEAISKYDGVWLFGCNSGSLGYDCLGDFELDLEWGTSITAMINEYGDQASALAMVNVDLYMYEDYAGYLANEGIVGGNIVDMANVIPDGGILAYSDTLLAEIILEFQANERSDFSYTYHLELDDVLEDVQGSAGDYWYDSFDAGMLIVSLEASGWAYSSGAVDGASLGGGLDPIGDDPEPWGDDDDDDDHADVPEPGTLGLLGIGLLGLGLARARRQRA